MKASTYASPEEYLEELRKDWLDSNEALAVLRGKRVCYSSTCEIDQEAWSQKIYSDFSGQRDFIVFEVRKKKWIKEIHHCVGCEIAGEKYILLSNEDLWNEGLP